jgi:hypothetical protein
MEVVYSGAGQHGVLGEQVTERRHGCSARLSKGTADA